MPVTETKSTKLPTPVVDQVDEERAKFHVPGHVVHTARSFAWAKLTPAQKRRLICKAKQLFPGRNLRTGRGNRLAS